MTQSKVYADGALREILAKAEVIAIIGHSNKRHRASYQIAGFLKDVGYTVYAVNPTVSQINGEKSYAALADVPEKIDIVSVFRRSEHLANIVDQAVAVGAKVVWAQLGVYDEEAVRKGEEAGITVIMDNCIKVTYLRTRPFE